MERITENTRQMLGCPYAPKAPALPVNCWRPAEGYKGPTPTVCPGYSTMLPETIEAARAWTYFEKGELTQFIGGGIATDELRERIEQMDIAIHENEAAGRTKPGQGAS